MPSPPKVLNIEVFRAQKEALRDENKYALIFHYKVEETFEEEKNSETFCPI